MAQFKQLKKTEAVHSFKEARARGSNPENDSSELMCRLLKLMAAQIRE